MEKKQEPKYCTECQVMINEISKHQWWCPTKDMFELVRNTARAVARLEDLLGEHFR
jgi:hypothetical protein